MPTIRDKDGKVTYDKSAHRHGENVSWTVEQDVVKVCEFDQNGKPTRVHEAIKLNPGDKGTDYGR